MTPGESPVAFRQIQGNAASLLGRAVASSSEGGDPSGARRWPVPGFASTPRSAPTWHLLRGHPSRHGLAHVASGALGGVQRGRGCWCNWFIGPAGSFGVRARGWRHARGTGLADSAARCEVGVVTETC